MLGPPTLLRRPRGLRMPSGTPAIDWSHKFAGGLICCCPMVNYGSLALARVHDLISGTTMNQLSNGARFAAGAAGIGLNLNSNAVGVASGVSSAPVANATSQFTLLEFFTVLGSVGSGSTFLLPGMQTGAGRYNWQLARSTGGTPADSSLILNWNNGSTNTNANLPSMLASGTAGTYAAAASLKMGGNYYAAVNGGATSTSGSVAAGSISYSGNVLTAATQGSGNYANVLMYLFAAWDRQFAMSELFELTSDPTGFLLFNEDRVFSLAATPQVSSMPSPAGTMMFAL